MSAAQEVWAAGSGNGGRARAEFARCRLGAAANRLWRIVQKAAWASRRWVDLRVLADNVRAIHCYESCGFVVAGREREAALVDGIRYDGVIVSILAPA